jgi:hypothetical protein
VVAGRGVVVVVAGRGVVVVVTGVGVVVVVTGLGVVVVVTGLGVVVVVVVAGLGVVVTAATVVGHLSRKATFWPAAAAVQSLSKVTPEQLHTGSMKPAQPSGLGAQVPVASVQLVFAQNCLAPQSELALQVLAQQTDQRPKGSTSQAPDGQPVPEAQEMKASSTRSTAPLEVAQGPGVHWHVWHPLLSYTAISPSVQSGHWSCGQQTPGRSALNGGNGFW